jgi:hypothetical protein
MLTRSINLGLIACSVLLAAPGCGRPGKPAESATASGPSTPAPDLGIQLLVEPASEEAKPFVGNVTTSLKSALTSAGYRLVEGDGKPDVQAKITIAASEEPSLFQVQVNGKAQVSYKVQLAASFVSASDASVVDQTNTEFSSSDGSVDASAIQKLVGHLGSTGKLAAYSGKLKEKALDEEKKVAQAEEDLWKAADVESCKKATSSKSCDGVRGYIAKYPSGKYTADGRKAMEDGDANMASVTEENAWAAAAVEQCQKPTKSYDCKGVEEYLQKYPAGAHAADAKAALKASEKERDALAKKEEANRKKESLAECSKECRRWYSNK